MVNVSLLQFYNSKFNGTTRQIGIEIKALSINELSIALGQLPFITAKCSVAIFLSKMIESSSGAAACINFQITAV